MNNTELAQSAIILAAELDTLACNYHVRSDQYEILGWEASILRAKAHDLIEGGGVQDNLTRSALISEWGNGLANDIPDIASKVKEFHEYYNKVKCL